MPMESAICTRKVCCKECGREYDVEGLLLDQRQYFDHPYNYDVGYSEYCLSCWLGVDPEP